MPFIVIKGSFHLVGRTAAGNLSGFSPDGDSIQFRPENPTLLDRLDRVGRPYKLSGIGSTQLRFEGGDALELHFDSTHQPRPLADEARDFLTGELGMNPVPFRPPDLVQVQPPVAKDSTPGFILSRALEANGRPVAFAFEGVPPDPDGSEVFLKPALLKKSLNYKSVENGHAYPLFYDTLFRDLRDTLAKAVVAARGAKRGLWAEDRSQLGLSITDQARLEQKGVLFPKLFRRLSEFLKESPPDMAAFLPWVEAKREPVLDLTTMNFTHFDDVLKVAGKKVSLIRRPEELVFVSAKTTSRAVAPWLSV